MTAEQWELADQEHNTSFILINSKGMVNPVNIPYRNEYS
ncbi:hypothetical protein VCR26J2_350678 [Vibrio coralliirubri]|nr:hypothetical protein VCR6J2_200060 [Vibrio coralliirubri]CDT47332.1 hypothetical protein VCR1J2_590202 [Vibrio coralliirubri]CDT72645.1 hypothetical protein VCR26J2_350678 [Vibrio coralliirubri]CDU02680.1 hypothetical protein VCR8J2_850177 [Vibrio coralliirubri]